VRLAAAIVVLAALAASLAACGEPEPRTEGVYLLMDAAGAGERETVRHVVEAVLSRLDAGDSFAVARLGPGRFGERDVIAQATFAARPDLASRAKRHLRERVAVFLDGAAPAPGTTIGTAGTADIAGAVLRAAAELKATQAGRKVILIFSDLAGGPTDAAPRPAPRDIPRALDGVEGVEVIVLDLAKLRPYSVDARAYLKRLADWRTRVEAGGGRWRVIDDLDRLDPGFLG